MHAGLGEGEGGGAGGEVIGYLGEPVAKAVDLARETDRRIESEPEDLR